MKCVGLMILFLHWSLSDAQRFVLKGPDDVVAAPGSDIILSCSLNNHESAVNMEVMWIRSDLNDRVVHHYKDQQDMNSEQDHLYRHRTSLFKDELKDGNTSLLLRNVQRSDAGTYKCEVQDGGVYDILMVKVIVTGPASIIVADPGSDIILSCSLNTRESAVNMEVMWSRSDLNDRVVHHYKDQQDSEQDPSYRNRTSLFKEKLKNGNTSLLLKDVQRSDEGTYRCEVQGKGTYEENIVTVTVTGIGTIPEITLLGYVSSGVHLLCETKGWKSKPDLEWVDSEGGELPVGDTEKLKDNELYTVRHTITTSHSGTKTFICRVKQHPMMNTEINIGQSSNPWKTLAITVTIILIITLCVIVAVGLTVYAYHKRLLCFKCRGLKMDVRNQMNGFSLSQAQPEQDGDAVHPGTCLTTKDDEEETQKDPDGVAQRQNKEIL